MKPYGLILAGGGAKGAYQIGAWKAMNEMGIEFEAIAGVSIGAINGALIAQGDFHRAVELWGNVEVASGINMAEELKDPSNLFSVSNLPQIFHEVFKNGGIDVTPAKNLIGSYVNEDAVRKSNIPLGIVTYHLSSFKSVELFVEEMEQGQLIDYLMASARFPGLNKQGPDGSSYLDGGVYDNAPIDVLRDRGINRLVVVDISAMKGMGHKQDLSCAEIVFIRPFDPKELGESFEFEKEMTKKRMEMGYFDAKKAFGQYFGKIYYFLESDYRSMQKKYGYKTVNELEELALTLDLPRLHLYSDSQFITLLKKEYENSKNEIIELKQVLENFSILKNHEGRKEVIKAITKRNKKDEKYKNAIEILDSIE